MSVKLVVLYNGIVPSGTQTGNDSSTYSQYRYVSPVIDLGEISPSLQLSGSATSIQFTGNATPVLGVAIQMFASTDGSSWYVTNAALATPYLSEGFVPIPFAFPGMARYVYFVLTSTDGYGDDNPIQPGGGPLFLELLYESDKCHDR